MPHCEVPVPIFVTSTPGYDKAGNMIGSQNPTISSTATYDAWNRLISVTDASTSITNDYDARGFRITETTGGVVRRYYYAPGWQCVEERTGTLTTPERPIRLRLRYIHDLVIRDRLIPLSLPLVWANLR